MFRFPLKTLAWIGAGLCIVPIVAVGVSAAGGTLETWERLWGTVMPRYIGNTLQLSLWVALGTAVIGAGTAWLVTLCRFPGQRVFEIVLALPLAFPAYVLAYAYTNFLDHPGPVQSALRAVTGWGPRDYWFPEIRSLGGAALMLTFVLYPYVYLLSRAAFLRQSPTAYFAARTMGHGPWSAFFRVSLPVARPAIAGGVILALMETISDFGTVAHFGVQTFATGIYQAWFSMGDRAAASQLAFCLMLAALFLVYMEARQRGGARHHQAGNRFEVMTPHVLTGWRALGAFVACLAPVMVGFVIPVVVLTQMAVRSGQSPFAPRYLDFIANSLTLAAIAAVLTVVGAILVGYRVRLAPGKAATITKTLSGIGYALPGSVIAVGLLVPFARFDNALDAFVREHFGFSTGLLFTGSIMLLVMAYTVRFMAAALSAFDTGMSQIRPNVDAVARTLGAGTLGMLLRVHLPLMRTSLLTAVLIVFVDTMKELPATLILRPFNFDTLAVQAHRLASDERLADAAVPSLVILAFGLLPVIVLCRTIARTQHTHEAPEPEMIVPVEPFEKSPA